MEEFVVHAGDVELRAIQPYSGLQAKEVDVTVRPDDCIILPGQSDGPIA